MKNIEIIGDPDPNRKYIFDPNLANELNKQTEVLIRKEKLKAKLEEKNKVPIPPTTKIDDSPISPIQNHSDFWTIPGVIYRDEIITVDLSKSLLDGGNRKSQNDWIVYSFGAKAGDFYTGDMPLHHAVFTAAYKMSDSPIKEEIRKFIKKFMFDHFLATTTRIYYQPIGSLEDIIVHNRSMSNEYSVKEEFVFGDEYVKDSIRPSNYKALLGVDELAKINSVYEWLTGKRVYLIRINSRSDKIMEGMGSFDTSLATANLSCAKTYSDIYYSLGIRIHPKIQSQNTSGVNIK
ncbi:MAG: hypothetical protein Q7S27_07050 [Nanoarchaeota archaeon]|nr:hypothetical protein [Nanoarchaeota archaeon]